MIWRITVLVFLAITNFSLIFRYLRLLQLSQYRNKEYTKYLKKDRYKTLVMLVISAILYFFGRNNEVLAYVSLCLVLLYISILAIIDAYSAKVKLKLTRRAIRLYFCILVTLIVISLAILCIPSNALFVGLCMFLVAVDTYILIIVNSLIFPLEEARNNKFVRKQAEVLSNSNCISIGITGSFGKTSVKNILSELLSYKYNVLSTAKNYNTPMGIAISLKDYINQDIFLAEMGARYPGDIKELSNLVNPFLGIITGVNNQHIETFLTEDAIYKEKKELMEHVVRNKGVVFFNLDNCNALKMYNECTGKKIGVSTLSNPMAKYSAIDINLLETGVRFTLIENKERYIFTSKLLGRHNISNILLCIAVARYFNISMELLSKATLQLQPIDNRLQVIHNKGLTIIDDTYNANIDGINFAIEAISKFSGRKVIVAQGIVEQGKQANEINQEIGKKISEVFDIAILVGENAKFLADGILSTESNSLQIFKFDSLSVAKQNFSRLFAKGDIIYFQNDLVN